MSSQLTHLNPFGKLKVHDKEEEKEQVDSKKQIMQPIEPQKKKKED